MPRFDAPTLARAWLAVAHASARKDDLSVLTRTVAIEEYPTGIRLVATDRTILLTAFVADLDAHYDGPPSFDAAPLRTVVCADTDGRGVGMLRYIRTLCNRAGVTDDDAPGTREVRVDFDVRVPAGTDPQESFEGMDPTFVVLSTPDVERVYLPVVEAEYPDWRKVTLSFRPEATKALAFTPAIVQQVAKVGAYADGPLVWSFGGPGRVSAVQWPESDPLVSGFVMPRRWTMPGEEPVDPVEGAADDIDEAVARWAEEFQDRGISLDDDETGDDEAGEES